VSVSTGRVPALRLDRVPGVGRLMSASSGVSGSPGRGVALGGESVAKAVRRQPAVWGWCVLAVLVLLFLAYYGSLTLVKYDALVTGVDLADVDQTLWQTLSGHPLRMTTLPHISNRLGIHVEPILLVLLPLYAILPSAKTLLLVQAVALALVAVPLYALATEELGDWVLALAFPLLYLLSPAIHNAVLSDFYPATLGVLPATAALLTLRRGQVRATLLLAGIALLAREDYGLWLAALAVIGWWTTRQRIWIAAGLVGVAWFLLSTLAIIPAFIEGERSMFWSRYGFWLDGPEAWRAQGFLPEKGRYLIALLFMGGAGVFLAPLWALPALPVLGLNLLSNFSLPVSLDNHYSTLIVPTFLAALAIGLHGRRRRWQLLAVTFVLVASLWIHVSQGRSPLAPGFDPPQPTTHTRALAVVAEKLPDDASVSVSQALASHFSGRQQLDVFPNCRDCEYVLLDVLQDRSRHPLDMRTRVFDLMDSGWSVRAGENGFLLLEREGPANPIPDSFYTFATSTNTPQYPASIVFGETWELVGFDVFTDYWDRPAVRLYWRVLEPPDGDWQPAVLALDEDGSALATPDTHTPVVLLWYPTSRWQPGETYVVEMLPFDAPDRIQLVAGVGAPLVEPSTRLETADGRGLVPLAVLERGPLGWRVTPAEPAEVSW
jgi:uncharacterized membrane protein